MFWIAAVSVISRIMRCATPGCARSCAPSADHQSGSMIESGETLRLARSVGAAASSAIDQLDHAMVDQPHQAELLGDRNDGARRHDGAVGARMRIRHS